VSDNELLGILLTAQSSEESLIRALREGALRQIPKFVDACIKPLQHDSYVVRIEAIKAVAAVGGANSTGALLPMLEDYDPLVRGHAAKALGNLGDRRALEALSERMVSEDLAEVKRAMRLAIDRINSGLIAPNAGQSDQLK
jgi:HEAT repeat protein